MRYAERFQKPWSVLQLGGICEQKNANGAMHSHGNPYASLPVRPPHQLAHTILSGTQQIQSLPLNQLFV